MEGVDPAFATPLGILLVVLILGALIIRGLISLIHLIVLRAVDYFTTRLDQLQERQDRTTDTLSRSIDKHADALQRQTDVIGGLNDKLERDESRAELMLTMLKSIVAKLEKTG